MEDLPINITDDTSHTISWEIEEEEDFNSRDLYVKEEFGHQKKIQFPFEMNKGDESNVIYVAVTKMQDQSMDALTWTLNNNNSDTTTTTLVYLIHVFPELRYISTPLGKLPLSQANPEQKETLMNQERMKRRDFLDPFLHLCSASKVGVETILIESDMEAKAILDLIPILNITNLVLGTDKSTLRKTKSKRGSTTVDQIVLNAPESCNVKIICEGKEVKEDQLTIESPPRANVKSPKQDHSNDTFACCFKPKAMS